MSTKGKQTLETVDEQAAIDAIDAIGELNRDLAAKNKLMAEKPKKAKAKAKGRKKSPYGEGIRKRGKRYNVQVRVKGQSIAKSFSTLTDAKAWKRKQETKIDEGAVITKDTLGDAIDRFIDERTPEKYQQTVLGWWKKQLGKKRLHELRKADIVTARRKLQSETGKSGEPITPATVNRRVAALSAVLTACTDEWFLIEVNPARIKSLPENNERDRLLGDGERNALLAACRASDQPALLPMVMVAMASGARAGELLELRAADIDLERGLAILRATKNGDTRTIPIRGNALVELKNYLEQYPVIGNAYIFRNVGGGVPFRYRVAWGSAKDAAKISDLRFHDLRHDAASNLARDGASLAEIGAVLGHRSAQMTKRYSHYVSEHISELGDRIAKRIDK